MMPYLGEFIGTMMLIILGDGVVANVTLNKSGMKGAGSVQITMAWGFAVMLPAFVFGRTSGASFNPALSIVLAINGNPMYAGGKLFGMIIAEIAGGFVGGCLVYALFKDHFDATESTATKLGVFCTAPSIRNIPRNFFSELMGTFILVFTILGLSQVPEAPQGVTNLLVYGIIASIGMSLGGLTGYAINPARDLGPRLAHAVLPIKGKGDSDFSYGLIVPVLGPICGALIAYGLYKILPWG